MKRIKISVLMLLSMPIAFSQVAGLPTESSQKFSSFITPFNFSHGGKVVKILDLSNIAETSDVEREYRAQRASGAVDESFKNMWVSVGDDDQVVALGMDIAFKLQARNFDQLPQKIRERSVKLKLPGWYVMMAKDSADYVSLIGALSKLPAVMVVQPNFRFDVPMPGVLRNQLVIDRDQVTVR